MNRDDIEKPNSGLLQKVLVSLAAPGTSFWRALCVVVVMGLTLWMTLLDAKIPIEWESIFLVVIGYYFKDRPRSEHLYFKGIDSEKPKPGLPEPLTPGTLGVIGEMTYQWLLATVLILGAAVAFFVPTLKLSISSTWIGGVLLAVGFYFKGSSFEALEEMHDRFCLIIAFEVLLLTVPLVILFVVKTKGETSVPVQWVEIVLIVVAFYFKEKKPENLPGRNDHRKIA